MNSQDRDMLKDLFHHSLAQMDPGLRVKHFLEEDQAEFLHDGGPIYLMAVGKASIPMAKAAAEHLPIEKNHTLVVTQDPDSPPDNLNVMRGSHPLPDVNSLKAGRKSLDFVGEIPAGATFLVLISGGTSSLLTLPVSGITIEDLAETYRLLLESGSGIHKINTVRKSLSAIKGGKLLSYLNPKATLVNLILSDIPGDDPSLVGSGPTIPVEREEVDVMGVLRDMGIAKKVPVTVRNHLKKHIRVDVNPPDRHQTNIIGSASMLAEKVGELAKEQGLETRLMSEPYTRSVDTVAKKILGDIRIKREDDEPVLLIYYGESTAKVTGDGRGGRNQELALHAAMGIEGLDGVTWLSAGTDGIDGPTDAAGAIVDGETIGRAREKGIKPETYLKNNDSYNFHQQVGTLLKTGPTGNNLMDLQLVLVRP